MSKKNKHKMSENFQSEEEKEKDVLNGAEQDETPAQDNDPKQEETPQETAEDKLARSEAEIADLKDRLLRQMAEFDNYRKRTMKE